MNRLLQMIGSLFRQLGRLLWQAVLPLVRRIYPPAGNITATADERKAARLKIVKIFLNPGETVTRKGIIILVVVLIALEAFGVLDPIGRAIDNEKFSIAIGSVYLSFYVILKTILWVIFLLWGTSHLTVLLEAQLNKFTHIHVSSRTLIYKILQSLIYFIAFIIVMNILGINLTSLALFSGALGIGIGFGLQKITANLISGFILTFERSLSPGTLVELENGRVGYIRKISVRYTLLETIEGLEILIPNEELVTNKLTNWTLSHKEVRVIILIGVSYDCDIDLAQKLILESMLENPKISQNKKPAVYLKDFGDNAVIFELVYWVGDVTLHWKDLRSEILFAVWHRFKANDISIPYPQIDVHMKNEQGI